jgi:hypothetical protein
VLDAVAEGQDAGDEPAVGAADGRVVDAARGGQRLEELLQRAGVAGRRADAHDQKVVAVLARLTLPAALKGFAHKNTSFLPVGTAA